MSEYMEIEAELSDDGLGIQFYTNLRLIDGEPENYESVAEMEEGSPVAQTLAVIDGIAQLRLDKHEITITRTPDAVWHAIEADVIAALKDFFI
ncbi:MAG: NifU N-terminal domain-containing protein [Ardenticatenaceae bacterium]|nr:NifU N-terminal domain-containing protein [Ardenticatenaceae bacterium]